MKSSGTARSRLRVLPVLSRLPRLRKGSRIALVAGITVVVFLGFLWVRYGLLIDARFGSDSPPPPRVFGRPFELSTGRAMTAEQLVQRLNDIGYAERPTVTQPGEFRVAGASVTLLTRPDNGGEPQEYRVEFGRAAVARITGPGDRPVKSITLEAPLLAALAPGEKRRYTQLASIPRHVVDAVLTIEDRRFYDHPGVDPIRIVGALVTNLRGDKPYLVGGSTITQQIIKNTFLTPAKTPLRKLQEQYMALVLESRFTKDQILELYLNEVVLGQRGPFEIRGVAEGARIFFGKDIRNVTVSEAATMAGIIQSPTRLSPFRNPDRARERRNLVLKEMADAEVITREAAAKAAKEPMRVATRALDSEAPYFVDYVSQLVNEKYRGLLRKDGAVDVYTTLDLNMQRFAQEALDEGIVQVDKQLAKRKQGQAQAALIAVDPRTGEILALIGGRAYNQSQYNRAVAARRQPGSAFKPFVYLAAFEQTARGAADLTPATVVIDEPTTFLDGMQKEYRPVNYQQEYDGPVTLRRALAHSRNVVAIKVAEATGYGNVAALWSRIGVGTQAQPYPSIALGVFEATPFEMATAYTLFTNNGAVRPLQAITRIVENGYSSEVPPGPMRSITAPNVTYLVTHMMRSVINEGTAAGARGRGFSLDAAGKTGTTNDLRDAWFIGFTPELLTAVWVGFDDNRPIGLSGSQAALPIWTAFMKRALAGRPNVPFDPPPGVVFAEIDPSTGRIATFACPAYFREIFLAGTEPHEICDVHQPFASFKRGTESLFGGLGRLFKRIIRR